MVAEIEKKSAFAEITELRRVTTMLVSGLMLSIGILAYVFGHNLVRPVQRLSKEATKVASGDLEVDIPVSGLSEVSYLTQVFNQMVTNLRRNREELSAANTALQDTNEELHKISITDGLTGLHSRKHIMDLLGHELARSGRSQASLAVLMIDIDHFKIINDTYGHQVGDRVMGQLAESFRGAVRECDHVGRYGGEEFMVILPDSSIGDAVLTAERIRQEAGKREFNEGGENFSATISIGVAGYPADGQDTATVIRHADSALYDAKASGRNQVMAAGAKRQEEMAKVHRLPSPKRVGNG